MANFLYRRIFFQNVGRIIGPVGLKNVYLVNITHVNDLFIDIFLKRGTFF